MLFVSDANIFIDLYKMDLLLCFDRLGFTIATSDFVYNELNELQRKVVDGLNVAVYEMDSNELTGFYTEFSELNLKQISYQDYSIFYYAQKYEGDVLSNDKRLRKFAKKRSVPVKGLFYILDAMVSQGCVSSPVMVEKLILLKEINIRLPVKEIDDRIEKLRL